MESDSVGLGWSLRFCLSHKVSGNADAAGPWTIHWVARTASDLHRRREARDATCLQERISACKAMFLMLQAKEMQQMVKLEAEMDRRPATVVWNSKTQTEAAKPHSIKSSLQNSWTQSPWKKVIVFYVSFMYRQDITRNHRFTYFCFTFWILEFPWPTKSSYKSTKITIPVRQSLIIDDAT